MAASLRLITNAGIFYRNEVAEHKSPIYHIPSGAQFERSGAWPLLRRSHISAPRAQRIVVPPSSTALQFLKLRETARVRSLWSASCYPVRGAKFWKSTAFGSSSHCLWRYRIFACRAANRVEGSQPAI